MFSNKTANNRIILLIVLFFSSFCLFPQDFITKAEDFLRYNQPSEAINLLTPLSEQANPEDKVFLYLSLAYEQLGEYARAAEVLQSGLNKSPSDPALLSYHMGNDYYRAGLYDAAESAYEYSIGLNYGYADAYLNRANTRVNLSDWEGALGDYKLYLTLRPNDPQKNSIQAMMTALEDQVQQEIQRLADEEERQRRAAEAQRLAAEQAQKAEEARLAREEELRRQEEARQAALLDDIFSSLEDISQETLNLSADSEDIEDYESDLDLAD